MIPVHISIQIVILIWRFEKTENIPIELQIAVVQS